MTYNEFGRTGVKVSPLCLGCMMFGGRATDKDSFAIIDKAIDSGINFLDTANVYSRGKSEELTGEALKLNGKRDSVFLATKVFGVMDDEDPNMQGSSRRHIIQQCEASLKRLQTDHIDLYQIHRPNPRVPIDETLRAFDDLIRSGKVRYIGSSTFAAWQVVESLWTSADLGLNRFVSEQPPYNILDRRIERELLPMCRTYGIAVLPWSPLGGGLLTGKYDAKFHFDGKSRYDWGKTPPQQKARLVEGVFETVEQLKPIAEAKGCTLSQLSLAWIMNQPGITSTIIGPRTPEQLEDNLKAAKISLLEEEQEAIDAVVPPGRMVAPFYEADFGPHRHRVRF